MRRVFEMTEDDLKVLREASKPVPMIMLQVGTPSSPQENANNAWEELGKKMGFNHMTVTPCQGKGPLLFNADEVEDG